MRIIVPSVQVPFISGGAALMTNGLANALRQAGHEVEVVTAPFKFFPEDYIHHLIDFWLTQDFNDFNGYRVDKVIVLQFPAYYVKHQNKAIWLMHQHRAVYDVFDGSNASVDLIKLRERVHKVDTVELSRIRPIYSMSKNISDRLKKFNNLVSIPLYHPPYGEKDYYCEEPYDYVFYPSRHEILKRQDLLINAMKHTRTPVKAMIAGVGGQTPRYRQMIEDLELKDKVKMIGQVTDEEKYIFYARSLAVFFGPYDEDYGYVTLEAMLSSKPVITCTDSGGPLEFVIDQENGFIVEPNPEFVAEKIDWLYENRQKAIEMGRSGFESYKKRNVSWENVVRRLL